MATDATQNRKPSPVSRRQDYALLAPLQAHSSRLLALLSVCSRVIFYAWLSVLDEIAGPLACHFLPTSACQTLATSGHGCPYPPPLSLTPPRTAPFRASASMFPCGYTQRPFKKTKPGLFLQHSMQAQARSRLPEKKRQEISGIKCIPLPLVKICYSIARGEACLSFRRGRGGSVICPPGPRS